MTSKSQYEPDRLGGEVASHFETSVSF